METLFLQNNQVPKLRGPKKSLPENRPRQIQKGSFISLFLENRSDRGLPR
jgi:hypothetical protein